MIKEIINKDNKQVMNEVAKNLIRKYKIDDSFYIADLKILENKINNWKEFLPSIVPFYAIKCNPNRGLIEHMIKKGLSFDCASMNELKLIIDLGLNNIEEKIIYSHPVKKRRDLKYANDIGIKYTTFDSLSELYKIMETSPNMKCLIRLHVDNPSARIQLGLKYGVHKDEYKSLLEKARDLNIEIVGCSFHVGSASNDPNVFFNGISYAKEVFLYCNNLGYNMNILDIGGGFTKENFIDCAKVIDQTLNEDKFWNNKKLIAEPGRYFAEEIFTFVSPIIGSRKRQERNEYWLSDSLYGSYNCIIYDDQIPTYEIVRNPLLDNNFDDKILYETTLFGSTCDSLDKLATIKLPELRNGDFILNSRFGAYTIAGATDFNGINLTNIPIYYINS